MFLNFDGPLSCPKILRYLFTDQSALPFTVSDKCCKILKEKPLDDFALENNKSVAIVGLVGGEGGRRDYFVKNCLSKLKNSIKFYPLKVVDKNWEDWFINRYDVKLCKLYYAPYNLKRTGCRGCPFDKFLQKDLGMLAKYFPLERNQCELIWKPVYDEYRRIGYRLKDKK